MKKDKTTEETKTDELKDEELEQASGGRRMAKANPGILLPVVQGVRIP